MNKELLELYSDYLISSFSYTTATGLSRMLDGEISHDKITRFLGKEEFNSKELWKQVKPVIRRLENTDGVLIADDTIVEKPYSKETELICWHYDHSKSRSIKGINLLNLIYEVSGIRIPVNYSVVEKDKWVWDKKKKKEVRRSSITKNEQLREMLQIAVQNQIKFKYIIADTWYSASETMKFIVKTLKKQFLMPIKSNRKIALSKKDKEMGKYQAVSTLELEQASTIEVYVEQCEFPLLLTKLIFKNEDKKEAILYLVSSDLTLDAQQMEALYQRRWSVEEFHASIKGNTAIAASPTKTKRSQLNHLFVSIYSFVKLELMGANLALNHFALRTKLYTKALKASFSELNRLRAEMSLGA